jgi:hypothetical protein
MNRQQGRELIAGLGLQRGRGINPERFVIAKCCLEHLTDLPGEQW